MRKLLLLLLLLTACSVNPKNEYKQFDSYYTKDDKLVHCMGENTEPKELLFHLSKQVASNIPNAPDEKYGVFYITDVNGNTFSLNTDELDNYTCVVVSENLTK